MTRITAPYGTWPSEITPAALVEQTVRLNHLTVSGQTVYWIEARPNEGGREVLVRCTGTEIADAVPTGFSVRTQVHEYGGRCYAVHRSTGDAGGDTLVFSNWDDQRLWLLRPGSEPEPLTPEPGTARAERYADPVFTPDGRTVIAVHEAHDPDGRVINDLVAIGTDPAANLHPARVLASGHDFYSAPRLSPDGSQLAWLSWDHPDMPWDATELSVASVSPGPILDDIRVVAGGPGESIAQPSWSAAGGLHYISDRTGWWNLYGPGGAPLCPAEADFAGPDWEFGNANYGFTPADELLAVWADAVGLRIGKIKDGIAIPIDCPFASYAYLHPVGDTTVVAVAASPTQYPVVARISTDNGKVEVLRRSRPDAIDPSHFSVPRAVEYPTGGQSKAHALFYPPTHADYEGPAGERPPLVVMVHGGPTGSATAELRPAVQYWTNRGFAVVDVDYRGSAGYGRTYRNLLEGAWGIADVEDCAAVVAWLNSQGVVDGSRAVIRGGSAGGFTTLACLAFTDAFAAGASLYGVADLELLARDTHKFEARYLDGLIGPWPEAADVYHQRSPIYHVDRIDSPLILFQGLEDRVVPPEQSQLMYDALRKRGVPVAYLAFEGEQHGFRQAETIMAVAEAELAFYGRVLGFVPAGAAPALEIANEAAISPRG